MKLPREVKGEELAESLLSRNRTRLYRMGKSGRRKG